MSKVSFTIDDQLKRRVDELKKRTYYNKSYAELFRDLVIKALDKVESEK